MSILDHEENKGSFSFEIHQKFRAEKKFHFTGKDQYVGFEGEAVLFIKPVPLFLNDVLEVGGDILVCENIKLNKDQFCSKLFERYFVKLISKALAELYKFSMFHYLPGVLVLIHQEEITPLTELQKHWLRDFRELFSFVDLSPKEVHQFYMPTNLKNFQHYRELDALLEESISPTWPVI